MDERLAELTIGMARAQRAIRESVLAAGRSLGVRFPDDYVDFMVQSNGAEGSVGKNAYLALWRVEELVPLNDSYHVEEFAPELVLFGSDGGGMAYAFDRNLERPRIVEVPFIDMGIEDPTPCGYSLTEFLERLWSRQ